MKKKKYSNVFRAFHIPSYHPAAYESNWRVRDTQAINGIEELYTQILRENVS